MPRGLKAQVRWTNGGERSLTELLVYLGTLPHGAPQERRHEIRTAIESLRYAPTMCPIWRVKNGKVFRCLVVSSRFLVYYIYLPPFRTRKYDIISIRAVKHGFRLDPFRGVREWPRRMGAGGRRI